MPLESKYLLFTIRDDPPPNDVSISQSESRSLVCSNSPPKIGCFDWLMALQSPGAILALRSVFYLLIVFNELSDKCHERDACECRKWLSV